MNSFKEKTITPSIIEKAMSYEEFRSLIDEQLKKDKTTGAKQSEDLTEYTRLNQQRMARLDKTIELNDRLKDKLQEIYETWIWLVLAEGWCGDVAQNLPVIAKIANESQNITLKIILRTENTEVMDQYLTNGGRSIPKLVCLDADSLEEIGTWGPRPGKFQRQAMQWKDDPNISHEEWAEKLHKWYAKDQSQTLQDDFEKLLDEWMSKVEGPKS
jgi:hypothetical protein